MTRRKSTYKEAPTLNIIKISCLVCVVFIALKLLKLTEIASWSWWWVLAPVWLPIILIIAFLMFLKWYEK